MTGKEDFWGSVNVVKEEDSDSPGVLKFSKDIELLKVLSLV